MPAAPARDPGRTAGQLEQWLPRVLPEARSLRVQMHGGPADTGFSSDTLLFDLRWCDGEGSVHREPLVARLEPSGFRVFRDYDVARQFRVLALLADTDVPVPRVRWLEPDREALGSAFYVMDRVEGRVPTDNPPYNAAGWLKEELGPSEREALWWSGLEAMSRVHRLDWQALGFRFLAGPDRGDPLASTLRELRELFEWGLDPERHPLIERALAWLTAERPAPRSERTALCWGDARPANQIFRGVECVAVLDWEMAHLGDPVHDLAWWIALDRSFAEGIGLERLAGLPGRAETVARWETLTGLPALHLDYYEVLSLCHFAIILSRVVQKLKHDDVLPESHAMDRDNLASIVLERKLAELGA